MQHYLEFDIFDNPMHLSKVGNWVITFLSDKDELEHIKLALTNVIPRHVSDKTQARRITLETTTHEQRWLITAIECYDSHHRSDFILDSNDPMVQTVLNIIIQEFLKYDVYIQILPHH